MGEWELSIGKSDDYYTPKYVFDALDCGTFDMDVAAAADPAKAFVQAQKYISENGLEALWQGFIWCNPPYGARGTKMPWVEKMADHCSGLMLMPDRTSADWWQVGARRCDDLLTTYDKIKFVGTIYTGCKCKKGTMKVILKDQVLVCEECAEPVTGEIFGPINSPGIGNTIFAYGERALDAIRTAEANNFGMTFKGRPTVVVVTVNPSWSTVIGMCVRDSGRPLSVQEIYNLVESIAPDKCRKNMHWREKVRQQLQRHFIKISKAVYTSAA